MSHTTSKKAIQLADRVLVMSNRPTTIQAMVDVDLPRPRDLDSRAIWRNATHLPRHGHEPPRRRNSRRMIMSHEEI